jgi:hypothetical protein
MVSRVGADLPTRGRHASTPNFFLFQPYFRKIFTFGPSEILYAILDRKLGAIGVFTPHRPNSLRHIQFLQI